MNDAPSQIAQRVLNLDGSPTVRVAIDAPKEGAQKEWVCGFAIHGLQSDIRSSVGGYDAIQAVQLAMQTVGVILYVSPEYEAGRLLWEDDRDLGFPLPATARDLDPSRK
jgi:hypothetical protein